MGNGVTVSNTATVSQQDVIDSLTEQLAKANERIVELELSRYIEQQIKGAEASFIAGYEYALKPVTSMHSRNQMLEHAKQHGEQLRKELEK